jgi:hypothetical protein
MPPQMDAGQPYQNQPGSEMPGSAESVSPPSRRSVLRGAAGAGAVGIVAATGAGAVFAATRSAHAASPAPAKQAVTVDAASQQAGREPLVAYLRDASTGEFEVFNGTSQVRFRNPRLATELLNGVQLAQ